MPCYDCKLPQSADAALAAATAAGEVDCFRMKKFYDWVKLKTELNALVMIPLADRAAIQAAIDAGDTVTVTAYAVNSEILSVVALVERHNSDPCACVHIRKTIPLHVTVTDETTGVILSQFTKEVQIFDTTKLCFPVGMQNDAIHVKVVGVEAISLSTNPVDGAIAFLLACCQDITVELDVMVKIKVEGLCASRAGVPCIGSISCDPGTPSYPAQCTAACL